MLIHCLKLLLKKFKDISFEINEDKNDYFKLVMKRLQCKLFNHSKNIKAENTIVLLHEGLGSIEMWKDWPTELALRTKMNLVLYSRIGMGKSSEEKIKKNLTFLIMRHFIICLK